MVCQTARALALITFVAGLASTIFVPLSDGLYHAYRWRNALVILALFLAVSTIPLHFLILLLRPDDMGLLPDGGLKSASPVSLPSITVHLKKRCVVNHFGC